MADVGGDYLEYWGKAQPLEGAESPFHPIAYQCLDVAAVMEALFAARTLVRERAAELFSASSESVARLFTALAALHDLGKFGTAFQAKRPDLIPQALRPLDAERVAPSLHTVDGFQLWEQRLGSRLAPRIWPGATASTFKPLSYGLFGHHGRPMRHRTTPVDSLYRRVAVLVHGVPAIRDGALVWSALLGRAIRRAVTVR